MSLMVHLQCFENGAVSKFHRSVVWDVFGSRCFSVNEGWALGYDNGFGGILYLDDDDFVGGCSVNRPSNSAILDLYQVARQVPSLVNLDRNFAAANPAFLAGAPSWLVNALPRPPTIVHSGEELIQCLNQS